MGDGGVTAPDGAANRLAWLAAGLEPVWRDRRIGVGIAGGAAVLWGALGGWWMPRGPLTTGEALGSMVLSFGVGVVAGLVTRSRGAMLGAPVLFACAYELVRIGTDGPLVDGLHLTTYGILAFVVGRGFHALLTLLPMLVGAAIGAGMARTAVVPPGDDRPGRGRVGRVTRRSVTVVAAVLLLVLAAALARPARTAAIVDANGDRVPGSIAELTTVRVDGRDLALMIRGHSVDNPVLLFFAGGPGGSELGAMRRHLPALEEHFTVVTWDQRGTGKSYPALEPTGTLTLDGAVADALAVTDHLRERFEQDRIYGLGQSWGSILGVLAVQAAPEKYAAFIGTGQMVSPRATDVAFYEDTLAWAEATGRSGLVRELAAIGPPPYAAVLHYELVASHEPDVYPYDHSANSEGAGGFSENFFVEEYTLLEQVHHLFAGFLDTYSVLYPQIQDVDLRDGATRFAVPVFFVQGAHEAGGRAELFEAWYPTVEAPVKDVTYLATSGHRPLFEQPDEFVAYLADVVLPRTTGAG